jgi:hypothetical protein
VRLFLEEGRRLKIIPNAFGEKAVLKLVFATMTRAVGRWQPNQLRAAKAFLTTPALQHSASRVRRNPGTLFELEMLSLLRRKTLSSSEV